MIKVALKKARMAKGITQNELAEMTGLNQSYISAIENNKAGSNPTLDVLAALAHALEICPKDLIDCQCEYSSLIVG